MKLKEKVKIDINGKAMEVKGVNIPYKSANINLDLIAHESRDAWLAGTLDVSEKSTGCRVLSTNIEVNKATTKDVLNLVEKEIENRGVENFKSRIQYMLDKTLKV